MMVRISVALLALIFPFAAAHAQPKKEQCVTQNNQFAETQFCVDTVLDPEGADKFGPEAFLEPDSGKAWCEGLTGYGIGESVTIRFKPAVRVQEFTFLNGNPKTAETYKNHSRVKQLRIQTSDGYAAFLTVPDTKEAHTIKLPRAVKPQWVRFSIGDVYPGERGGDTCIAGIIPNFEQANQ